MGISIFWFRRDLRLEDNTALFEAITKKTNILPIFIFDEDILDELPKNDSRVYFIYNTLKSIHQELLENSSSLLIMKGKIENVWEELIQKYSIKSVFINKDYEPYAIKRDQKIKQLLAANNIELISCKDQVIHEESEVLKPDGTPYTVFTPYKNKWLTLYEAQKIKPTITFESFRKKKYSFPSLEEQTRPRSE